MSVLWDSDVIKQNAIKLERLGGHSCRKELVSNLPKRARNVGERNKRRNSDNCL